MKRTPSFETLLRIILEQQVSLASAKAAFNKLKEKASSITPETILSLTDEELRNCYFSRQKSSYARHLAQSIMDNQLQLKSLESASNEAIRKALKKIKGIGNWTAEVYLMMALQRPDQFPLGDIALIKSFKETKNLPANTTIEEIALIAAKWKPYQTIAAYILWHAYLSRRKK